MASAAAEQFPSDALPGLRALEAQFPDAPKTDLRRFACARRQDPRAAVQLYKDHLIWRQGEGTPRALAEALSAIPQKMFSGVSKQSSALDGTGVIFVELARYDPNLCPVLTYALAACCLFEEGLRRQADGQFTLVIDTRPGRGFKNPLPQTVIPLLKEMNRIVSTSYPETLRRIIVYPVPWTLSILVGMAKRILDARTREKLVILSGTDLPAEGLLKHLSASSFPPHCWGRHTSLIPPDMIVDLESQTTARTTQLADKCNGDDEEFFSADEDERDTEESTLPGISTGRVSGLRNPKQAETAKGARLQDQRQGEDERDLLVGTEVIHRPWIPCRCFVRRRR